MNVSEHYLIRYGPLTLDFSAPGALASEVRAELEPFFAFAPHQAEAARSFATLRVFQRAPENDRLPAGEPTRLSVDTSLYKHLASEGLRWGGEYQYTILIELTQTWAFLDNAAVIVDLYQPDDKLCLTDTVRTIKSLFTPALELAGGIQLHGSAVIGQGECVLILADMWQGKTTLLLELLAQFNVAQLSCDTVVLTHPPDGGIHVAGWPSPFSVSHGTLADFPELYPHFPTDRATTLYGDLWEERKKSVLTSSDVVWSFGTTLVPESSRLDVCILARFAPHEPSAIERVSDPDILRAFLGGVCLGSRDPIYHNWHRLIVCPEEWLDASIDGWTHHLLETTEVYRMTWAPSAVSLMKRVPKVARLHKHLPRILDFSAPE
jgi:hypothetical protein